MAIPESFIPSQTMVHRQCARPMNILVINPNSNNSMTTGLQKLIEGLNYPSESASFKTYTAPSGPSSINSAADTLSSAQIVYSHLSSTPSLLSNDAFIVACYSSHPLVSFLRSHQAIARQPIIGIFEASISLGLSLLPITGNNSDISLAPSTSFPDQGKQRTFTAAKFGIVTTGAAWVPLLTSGVNAYLGLPPSEISQSAKFKGVESTGLSAEELHSAPAEEVEARMIAATRRLIRDGDVGVVVLGCAGMAGMDEWVRKACEEELGEEAGGRVRIVDGVKAAVAMAMAIADGVVPRI